MGRKLDILFPDDSKTECMAHISRASAGERWEVLEIPILHKDGSVRTLLWNSATVYGVDGKTPIATIAQGQDITERRQIEKAMHLERDRLISILNSMEDGVCIMNRNFSLEYVNPSLQSQYGNIDGRTCYQYFYGRDDVCPWCNNREVFGGTTVRKETHSARTGLTYEETDAPLKNVDGSTSKLAVFHDITERKKVDELKDEFIGMVSHELKTPLTVIMGALATAADERVSEEEARELLGDAVVHAGILTSIVENLLELSRQQSGRLSLQTEPVEVGEVTRMVIDKLQGKSAIHHLVNDVPLTLPAALADPFRVERIIYNLVDNAIKYSPDGGEVKISAHKGKNCVVVGVSDQGPGIARNDQARLFQSFERLGVAVKGSIQGTGLGLKVCRILVEAHGGRIWVKSYKGQGSTFFFTLPTSER